jgi:hypothetical protein
MGGITRWAPRVRPLNERRPPTRPTRIPDGETRPSITPPARNTRPRATRSMSSAFRTGRDGDQRVDHRVVEIGDGAGGRAHPGDRDGDRDTRGHSDEGADDADQEALTGNAAA